MTATSLSELNHVVKKLPNGGQVLVLETGALIGPEEEAMLQALHSRSVGGIEEHLQSLGEKGAEKFMSTYYVGYNHKSIGDCGTGTIFIEGVSMLAAKAIQDWKLYSGQESSTRYIDFSSQPFLNPVGTPEGERILETWRAFYLEGLEELIPALEKRFPRKEGEKQGEYKKAIKARAFDIMGSFLPSGAATNLAWHSNLRQIADKLMLLRHHPLVEVRNIAEAIEEGVNEMFPNSFGHKRYEETERYNRAWVAAENYFEAPVGYPDFVVRREDIDEDLLNFVGPILADRPPKTELPKFLDELGTIQHEFLLDFRSYRDMQRHRSSTQRMPLVTMKHGFEEWYLDELPEHLCAKAVGWLEIQKRAIEALGVSKEVVQYYIPMGYKLPNRLTGTLPSLVYLVELRATRFVHPTLRKRAQQIATSLEESFACYGLRLHLDDDSDRFDVKRGAQDIVEKST